MGDNEIAVALLLSKIFLIGLVVPLLLLTLGRGVCFFLSGTAALLDEIDDAWRRIKRRDRK